MKRRFSHLTPRYIFNRIAVIIDEKRFPSHPWITADAVRILSTCLKPTDVGVEFGSGRSTAWFATRLASLCSVESNTIWYEKVKKELIQSGLIVKVDYRLCEDEINYIKQIETFQEETIEFCLVDGMVRDQCALHMLPKIKRGGLIVIDNQYLRQITPPPTQFQPDESDQYP